MASWTTERARHAALSRRRPADDPAVTESRQNLRAARAEDYIRELVAAAPALTAAQLDKLAILLLRGGTS